MSNEASQLIVEIDGDLWDRYCVTEQGRGWFDDDGKDEDAIDKQRVHEQKIVHLIANAPLAYDLLRRLIEVCDQGVDDRGILNSLNAYLSLAYEARGVLKAFEEDAS